MKKNLSILLTVLLFLSSLYVGVLAAGGNTLEIDSFEDDSPKLLGDFTSGFGTISLDGSVSRNGSKSLKFVKDAVNTFPEIHSGDGNNVNTAGMKGLEFWLKTEGLSGDIKFALYLFDQSGKRWDNAVITPLSSASTEADFVKYVFEFEEFASGSDTYDPDAADAGIKLIWLQGYGVQAQSFTLWIDDMALTDSIDQGGEEPGEPADLVVIDNFEDEGPNLPTGYWSSHFTLEKDSMVKNSGSKSYKMVKDNASAYPELHSAQNTLSYATAGKKSLEFYLKTSGLSKSHASFMVYMDDNNGNRYTNLITVDKALTEAGFQKFSYNFEDFVSGANIFDPDLAGVKITNLILQGYEVQAETFTVWLDDIALSSEVGQAPAEPEPIDPEPTGEPQPLPERPTPDTSGYYTPLQNFDDVEDVDDSGFGLEDITHNNGLEIETNPEYVQGGSQSIRLDFSGEKGWTGIKALGINLGEFSLAGHDHIEFWVKTQAFEGSPEGSLSKFNANVRFNLEGIWFAKTVVLYKEHTDEDWVQVKVALTDLTGGPTAMPFDPETDHLYPYEFQIDFTTFLAPYSIWIDSIYFSSVEEPDTTQYFEVSFNSMGGTIVDDQTVAEGDLVIKPEDPVRSGYDFAGWQVNIDGEYVDYDFLAPVTSDLMLRARWVDEGTLPPVTGDQNGQSPSTGDNVIFILLGLMLAFFAGFIVMKRKTGLQ